MQQLQNRLATVLLFLIALSSVLSLPSWADKISYSFENIAKAQGLGNINVRQVVQDQQGYLWAGTENGLYRYDGYGFKSYKHNPQDLNSLADNYIYSLFEDSRGTLWIGTGMGVLHQYNAQQDSFIRFPFDKNHPDTLESTSFIFSIIQRNEALWIATFGGGISRFDLNSKKMTDNYRHDANDKTSLSDNKVYTLLADSHGFIWVGTRNGGLNRFDPKSGKFKRYQHQPNDPTSLSHNRVYTLLEDTAGILWIGTRGGGLNRFDRHSQSFQHYRFNPDDANSLSSDQVWSLFEDKTGALWVGTHDAGVNIFSSDAQSFYRYQHHPQNINSLVHNRVMSMIQDQTGLIWLGTYGGLSKFDPTSQRFGYVAHQTNQPNSLSKGEIHAILKDKAGIVWAGGPSGLNRYDQTTGQFKHYQHDPDNPQSLSDNNIRAIFEDSTGTLWIGTFSGLDRFNPQDNTFIHYQHNINNRNSLSDNYIFAISEDEVGNLWLGSQNGLNRFNFRTNTFSHFFHQADSATSISANEILTLFAATDGTLWVGTNGGGLNQFNHQNQTFTRYQYHPDQPNSLSNNTVSSIYQDNQGMFWLGTEGGLNQFDPSKQSFTHYREKDGLSNDTVYAVSGDKNGKLWLGLTDGISLFDPLTASFKNHIGAQTHCGANYDAAFKAADGQLFFGSQGYCAFYPENVILPSQPPKLVFTDFRLLNKTVPIASEHSLSPLTQVINHTKSITLTHEDNVLSFEFAALHYADSKRNQYKYKLAGFNRDWIETGSQNRQATYTNLPAGNYSFEVKASNNEGVWTKQNKVIRLTILPAPWRTWWAYTLYTLLLFSLIGGFIYQKNAQQRKIHKALRAVNETLEQQVQTRTQALQDSIDQLKAAQKQLVEAEKMASLGNLVAGVAHEVNTPLGVCITMVSLHIEKLTALTEHKIAGTMTRKCLDEYIETTTQSQALVENNLHRAAELIQSFKKVAVEQTQDSYSEIVFHDYLTDILRSIVPGIKDQQIEIKLLSQGDWAIKTCPGAWWQLLSNLIENSLNHGFFDKSSGEITISADLTQQRLRFIYRDNGSGMTPEQLNKIYEPFYTTSRSRGDTGLGMHIVYNLIVQKLSGSINCQSEPGQGVVFTIEVPI